MAVYLDNSATTKPCKACVDAVMTMLTDDFGNPSSLHFQGINAHRHIESAREALANILGAKDKNEIIFTSGATEANNIAIFGAARVKRRSGNRIVTTAIEHESVLQSIDELEKQGFEVIRIKPNEFGEISEQAILEAVNEDTILVSMMMVNNEIGSVLPVDKIKAALKAVNSDAIIHIDAVQAFGKIPVKVMKLGADLLSVTAHKIHGSKGCGALYIRKGIRILPLCFGGEQEKKIRPGTESAALIAGFEGAVNDIGSMDEHFENVKEIRDYCVKKLTDMENIKINSGENALPYIINFAVKGIRSQTLIQFLSSLGICVSNGSACSKGKKSHVLTAMCIGNDIIDSSIRVSFSKHTVKEDIDALCDGILAAQNSLARR